MPTDAPMTSEDRRVRFGRALRAFRINDDWSQAGFAREIGKDQPIVSSYESGKTEPSIDTVVTMEEVLKLNPGTLSRYLGWVPVDAADTVEPPEVEIVKGVIQSESVRAVELFCKQVGVRRSPSPRQSLVDRVAELEKVIDTFVGGGGA